MKNIDYSNKTILNDNGIEIYILNLKEKKNGFKIWNYICPFCGQISHANISNIKRGDGCKNCKYKRIADKRRKTHEEYVSELKLKNPFIKVIGTYIGESVAIHHQCPICKRNDWLLAPGNALQGTMMCDNCNKSYNNSVFAEIAQQYLFNKNIAIPEYDIGYKKLSYYDLYIPSQNLLIEIQSEYHDLKIEKDLAKKQFAINKGFNVKYVDIRTENVFNFIREFYPDVTWDDIFDVVNLSKICVKKIVQLSLDGELIKIWYGGTAEISECTGFTISRISMASRGINGDFQHIYKNYLWYLYDDYINLDDIQNISKDTIHKVNLKNKEFVYKAISLKNGSCIISDTAQDLANKINSHASLIIKCLNGQRKQTGGYEIIRYLKEEEIC